MYQLKAGEYTKGGKLYGWTGKTCPDCSGTGEGLGRRTLCAGCGGTGEEHAEMPVQPTDLPPDTD